MEPKDFYFQLVREGEPHFLITPKKYYDSEGCLSDESGVADGVLPHGFGEATESTYEFDGNIDTGRELLLAAGMEEIDFGFNNRVEPTETSDEDEEFDEDDYHGDEEETNNDDLDSLLNEDNNNAEVPTAPGDYTNVATDKLMRHLQMMLKCESFEEAAKIRDELTGRGVIIE